MHRTLTLAQQGAAAVETASGKSILEYIHEGGVLSYFLVFLSVVAVSLLIRNVIIFSRRRISPPGDFDRLDAMLRDNDMDGALAYCADPENASFLTRVFGSALSRCASSPFGYLELRAALEESGVREADRLHRSNEGLGVIAAVGPMLGLLGTVIGIIGAFTAIGNLEGAARSKELAMFMSYALVCTAEGLAVAIPCTVAFSLFRRRIDDLVNEVAERIEHLIRHVERASGGGGPQARTGQSPPVGLVRNANVS